MKLLFQDGNTLKAILKSMTNFKDNANITIDYLNDEIERLKTMLTFEQGLSIIAQVDIPEFAIVCVENKITSKINTNSKP